MTEGKHDDDRILSYSVQPLICITLRVSFLAVASRVLSLPSPYPSIDIGQYASGHGVPCFD